MTSNIIKFIYQDKIVEEKNIDISSIKGTGKAGRISKGDLITLMGNVPQPSKRKSFTLNGNGTSGNAETT